MESQTSLLSYSDKTIDFNHLTRTETFTAYNKRGIPFAGSVSAQIIPFSDLVFSPLVQLKCVTCGFFGRNLGCNPKTAPYYVWKERLSKYNFFLLVIGKIDVRARIEDNLTLISSDWRAKYYAGNEGSNVLKKRVKDRRVETLNYLSFFGGVETLIEGGGDRGKKTSLALHSPEAIGIDLYSMLPMEVPPIDTYYSVSMVYGNLDHDFTSLNLPKRNENTNHILNLNNVVKVYDVKDIWQPDVSKARCETCKLKTPFLCNRDRYRDDDLYQTIKDWKLYVIRLKNSIKTVKGIKELHNYQLEAHRQGYWESFQLLPFRCPIHKDCSLKTHMEGGYQLVQNRAIPLCISYFNLKVEEKGEKLGYLLV